MSPYAIDQKIKVIIGLILSNKATKQNEQDIESLIRRRKKGLVKLPSARRIRRTKPFPRKILY